MKTTMQKLMINVQSINERYELKEDANWLMNEIINLIEDSFEKEKEQIENACNYGIQYGYTTKGEQYYNKTYKPETI